MKVFKDGQLHDQVEAKHMSVKEFRDDYQFERANQMVVALFEAGLIDEKVMNTALDLNKKKFSPYLKELL